MPRNYCSQADEDGGKHCSCYYKDGWPCCNCGEDPLNDGTYETDDDGSSEGNRE